jgi:hypothetical protein
LGSSDPPASDSWVWDCRLCPPQNSSFSSIQLVVFNILVRLHNCHRYLIQNIFITSERHPKPISRHCPLPPAPCKDDFCFLSLWFPALDSPFEQSHTACGPSV